MSISSVGLRNLIFNWPLAWRYLAVSPVIASARVPVKPPVGERVQGLCLLDFASGQRR